MIHKKDHFCNFYKNFFLWKLFPKKKTLTLNYSYSYYLGPTPHIEKYLVYNPTMKKKNIDSITTLVLVLVLVLAQ